MFRVPSPPAAVAHSITAWELKSQCLWVLGCSCDLLSATLSALFDLVMAMLTPIAKFFLILHKVAADETKFCDHKHTPTIRGRWDDGLRFRRAESASCFWENHRSKGFT